MQMFFTAKWDNGQRSDATITASNYKDIIKLITDAYEVESEQHSFNDYNTATRRTRCSLAVIDNFVTNMCKHGSCVSRKDGRVRQAYEQAINRVANFYSITVNDVKLCLTDRLDLTDRQILEQLYKLYFSVGRDTTIFKEVLSHSRGLTYQSDSDASNLCIDRVQVRLSNIM